MKETKNILKMNEHLYKYLERTFYRDNIKKYHKYFAIWVVNLTANQLIGFQHMMEVDEAGLLRL